MYIHLRDHIVNIDLQLLILFNTHNAFQEVPSSRHFHKRGLPTLSHCPEPQVGSTSLVNSSSAVVVALKLVSSLHEPCRNDYSCSWLRVWLFLSDGPIGGWAAVLEHFEFWWMLLSGSPKRLNQLISPPTVHESARFHSLPSSRYFYPCLYISICWGTAPGEQGWSRGTMED